ncbi:Ger(x)C family spore germination protein [Ornithinibacillus halophilus]|uniref:Germination protein, Ger(X)C family n=1 Tax=Ornithinibacillus halophilus TaxID=930117 RepID=A0A1M5IAQ6_9BACI|nr:Ger(x)C family spore germination protein [Ornithinibacillus halophilus]SHG24980.1 germination protein, Ger(x)C family [Ornithinibacillus halophilus]
MMTTITKSISLFAMLVFLSGCWDQVELEGRAYVVGLGMDKIDDETNQIRITFLISNPEFGSLAEGGGGDEPPQEIISFVANDMESAKDVANMVVAKQVTYDLLRVLFISEEFAKDPEFIRWMYDLTKSKEIRRDIRLVVSKEKASTFIQNINPLLESRPHEYFEKIFERLNATGIAPTSDLLKFFRITESDADLFLSIYGTSLQKNNSGSVQNPLNITAGEFQYEGMTSPIQFAGAAVFKEGKMIGTITTRETRLAYLLNPTLPIKDILTAYPDPFSEDHKLAIRVEKQGKVKTKMDLKKEVPSIDVSLPLAVEVLSNHSMVDYPKEAEKREQLKKHLDDEITKVFEDFIKKTQEEYGTEPFGWSLEARKHFRTLPEFEKFDWMKTYPNMDINVDISIRFSNFGRQGEVPKLEELRD